MVWELRVRVKGGALAGGGFDEDVAAEEVGEVSGDGETESGAAVGAGDGGVGLGEGFEEAFGFVLGHADAGVEDFEGDVGGVFCGGGAVDLEC